MSGGRVAMTARCIEGHDNALWVGTEGTVGGGTDWTSSCVQCGDRPWTVAAQAARRGLNEAPTDPALSLRPVLNTASQAARAWYSRLTRRNA